MTRLRCLLVPLLIAGAPGVVGDAQSRTADAVSAMMRGDFQQAAVILEPIVQDRRQRDAAAAFFMATLYDTGRGVPADPLRACALYQQAFFDESSVYAPTAQLLQRRLWMARGNDFLAECQLVANIGIDHRFQPETFTLGPAHSVEWTLAAATVTYENRTHRTPLGLMGPRGTMFLPLRYTELQTASSPGSLHFFELFWWEPLATQWTLRARLYEVYRDELVPAGGTDALTTVTAAEPPSMTEADLRRLVNLRVDALGGVELTIGGIHPSTQIIATRAEKLATLEKERARAAADARIDWNAALDLDRTPSLTYTEAQGCANIFLYASSEDRGEVVTFRADARSLQLTSQPQRFDMSKQPQPFTLQVHVYERPVRANPCSDALSPMPSAAAWQAVSGIVEIELSRRAIESHAEHRRRATVRILGAEFLGPAGKRIRLSHPIVLTAIVGDWFG